MLHDWPLEMPNGLLLVVAVGAAEEERATVVDALGLAVGDAVAM
jgi:hypothetical protein